MKKFFVLTLLLVLMPLYAQYTEIEIFSQYYTNITLCSNKNQSYVLINNGYADFPEYLIIFGDTNYTPRQVYGEILLTYYNIKHKKREIRMYNGEPYTYYLDNSEEEISFLRALTDTFILEEYDSFSYIDKNSSKEESIKFYDEFEGSNKEESIGSNAGILMKIKGNDFMDLLIQIK